MNRNYASEVWQAVAKRRARRRIYQLAIGGAITFFLLLSLLYFVTPLSRVDRVKLKGRHAYSREYVSELVLPQKEVFLPTFDRRNSTRLLEANTLFEDVTIQVTPFDVVVDFHDVVPIFQYNGISYLSSGERTPGYLPEKIFAVDREEYLSSLPLFFFGSEVAEGNKTPRYAFEKFSNVDALSLLEVDYVVLSSNVVYHLYLKDRTEDFYYKIKLSKDQLNDFVSSSRFKVLMDTVHSDLPSFKGCLEDDTINNTDIKVSVWLVPDSQDRFIGEKVCNRSTRY